MARAGKALAICIALIEGLMVLSHTREGDYIPSFNVVIRQDFGSIDIESAAASEPCVVDELVRLYVQPCSSHG